MSVAPFTIEPLQKDLLRPADFFAECRASLRRAIDRITVKEVAYDLNLSPGSVENQLRFWSRRKKPSADMAYLALKRDRQHLTEITGQCGVHIVEPLRLRPEESLRTLGARASAKGYVSAEEVAELVAQTDFGVSR